MEAYTLLPGRRLVSASHPDPALSFFLIPRQYNDGSLVPFSVLAHVQNLIERAIGKAAICAAQLAEGEWHGQNELHFVWYVDPHTVHEARLKEALRNIADLLGQHSIFLYLRGEPSFLEPMQGGQHGSLQNNVH